MRKRLSVFAFIALCMGVFVVAPCLCSAQVQDYYGTGIVAQTAEGFGKMQKAYSANTPFYGWGYTRYPAGVPARYIPPYYPPSFSYGYTGGLWR